MWQRTAALREFNPVNVGCGSWTVALKLIAPFHHMAAAGPLIAVSSHPYRRLQSNCRLPCSLRANAPLFGAPWRDT